MGRQKEVLSAVGGRLRIRNKLLRQALAECLGTLVLVVSGTGTRVLGASFRLLAMKVLCQNAARGLSDI